MAKYRKKPVEIEAVQWAGTAAAATPIIDWILANGGTARYDEYRPADRRPSGYVLREAVPSHIAIDTLEGTVRATEGDWIIRGIKGEFYPCKPEIFESTYQRGGIGQTSDGFHTFDELYQHRMMLNAVLFNEWGTVFGEAPVFGVHRSRLHHTGEKPFGGGWFVVMAQLPTGQISYHYPIEHWDLFIHVPERERAAEWDGHTSEQVVDRLQRWLKGDS